MAVLVKWALFLVPLLTLFFIGKGHLKRYLPVALLVTVINTLFYQAGYYYAWWRESGIFEWDQMIPVQWIYTAYPAATLWLFRFTYGRFWLYILVNAILDGAYVYLWYPVQQKMGMAITETTLPNWVVYLLMVGTAILIYGYQKWQEGSFRPMTETDDSKRDTMRWSIGKREKAK
jgi:hypothetical protein